MHLLLILVGVIVLAAYLGGRGLAVLTLAGIGLFFFWGAFVSTHNMSPPDDDVVDPVCVQQWRAKHNNNPNWVFALDDCGRPRQKADRWVLNAECVKRWHDESSCHYLVTSAVAVGRSTDSSRQPGAGD